MKYFVKNKKQILIVIFINLFYIFIIKSPLYTSPKNNNNFGIKGNNSFQNKKIKWDKLEINHNNEYKLKWENFKLNQEKNKIKKIDHIIKSKEKKTKSKKYYLQSIDDLLPKQISPTIQINNYPKIGGFSQDFNLKSAFSGGVAGGTGNQNYSYRFDYSLNSNTYFSGYISEADDPYFNNIKNYKTVKNFWRNYSVVFNKKINQNKYKKLKLSFNSAIEVWDLHTVYKKDNTINYSANEKIIGSFAFPATFNLNNRINITGSPRFSFLPEKVGNGVISQNYYGNSFSVGFGGDLKINKSLYFLTGYSFIFGPGYNSFDENMEFSRNNIYNIGFQWDPSSRINLRFLITNGFGETPSTGNLTIPSDNLPLYSFNLKLNSFYFDPPLRLFTEREYSLLHKGHTIDTALVPEFGKNQIWLNFDNKNSSFGYYGYSFSDIFQVEIINLGSFRNQTINSSEKYKKLINIFAGEKNLNNRFGGKLLLLSPTKGDPFWLSTRITLGRNQESVQGYHFIEIPSTFEINSKIALNISPKYLWSGIGNLSGLGLGINYKINNKFQLIPEMILNIPDDEHNNNSIILRYFNHKNNSLDLYLSNALGTQDLGQLIKSNYYKYGFKLNFIF